MIFSTVPRFFIALILLSGVSLQALAGTELEQWRIEMVQVRGLAENDIPQAYTKAQGLQSGVPSDATPADRVRLLNLLARIELYRGESAAVDRYAEQALELAAKHDDRIGQAETDLLISLNAVNQSQFDRMKAAIHHSMEMLEGSDRKDLLVEAMLRTSMMYLRFGLQDESTAMAMRTLEVAKHGSNPLALTYAHQGMAIVYEQSRNHSEARDHYKKMLVYAQDAHSRLLEASAMLGLGGVLSDLGSAASGERLVQDAVTIHRKAGGPFYTAHALNMLANFQRKRGHLAGALVSLDEAAQIYEQRQNKVGLWWSLRNRSEVLEAMNKTALSQADAERGYKLAREMGVALYIGESARRLAALAAKRGNYQKAYALFSEAEEMASKDAFEKSRKRIFDLAQQFEEESKQRKIEELNRHAERQHAQQLQLLIMLAGAASLLAVMAFFLLRLRKSRAEIRTLNARLEQRVLERTAELFDSQQSLAEAQRIAHVGSWENNLLDNVLIWSEEVYRIFEIDPQQFGTSYEAFMEWVHPDDRGMLDNAFKASLENREPFEIEHRLLLPDGRIKYVHEHCETSYDTDGRPLRSIGTVQEITERKEMENALYESRQLMAEAQRIAKVGSWEYDIATDTHTWSDELFRIYEIDPETEGASYEGCMSVTHPDDREAISNAYLKAVETGYPYESEHRLQMKDGRIKYVHERGETVRGPDGVLLRAVGMMQDITARKLAEHKLTEALEFSEGIINAIPDILFEMDRNGQYLNIWTQNPELLAAQKQALLGKTVGEVLSPENAAAAMAAIREADENEVANGKVMRIDLPQGTFWFEHSLAKKSARTPDEATFIVLSRDITPRMRMEEALSSRERELRALAESSPGMMGCFHRKLDGSVCMPYVSANIYELFGLHPQDVAEDASSLVKLHHPDDAQRVMDAIAESARTMTRWHCEYRIEHPTKGERWMEGNTNPEPHPDGGIVWYGYVHDITERKHYEHELRRTLDFQQTLLKGIKDVGLQMIVLENGRVIHVNNLEFAAQMGYDVEAIAGQPNFLDIIHPDDMERVADNYFRRINGEPVPDINELSVVMADGSRREHEVAVSVIPGTDPVRMIAISRDITARKLTEQRLKEALEFSEGVINAIPDLLFEMNREGRYLNIWTHTPELLAVHNKKLLGNTVSEMLAPETAATVLEALREAESQGLSFGKVIHIELPQGTSWFELSVSQKPSGTFLMLSRDITGRKRMENDLRISEERMRLFFERQLIGAAITSPQKGWIQVNDKVCEMLGYSREELVRLTWAELTYPDDLSADVAQFERLLSGEIEDYTLEKRFVHKDGRIVFTNLAVGCVRQADRTVEYVIALLDDITERKCLEAELRDSRNFLDSVIDAVPDPVFVKDRKHRWVLLNNANCRFTGMSREALIGKSDYDIFSKEQADVFWERDELVFESGEVNLNEESFTSADGEEHFIQTKKTPFVSADGSQMLVGVIRDITERKHYETAREAALAEAEHLAKMRSEFIAHMSHELRTPLNSILGYAQMLGRDGKLDEKQHASMEVIRQSGEHLLSLIEDILDLARIESGKLELEISDIPLAGFLNVVAGIIGVRAKQKQIEFVCEFAPDLPQGVRGDDKRLRQVLLNLLSNAIKFTDRGRVTLCVSRVSPSRLAFAIADTGIGIAASDRETIFQSFEQVSDTQHKLGGTGLGLTISLQLVRMMGGDIVVESRPGEGSIFRFELELSNASIEPDVLCMPAVDMQQVDPDGESKAGKPLIAPQQEALQALHRLALLGNMRDIANYAERIASLDPRYAPFAEHLKRLANSYQSKAILAFVEEHLI